MLCPGSISCQRPGKQASSSSSSSSSTAACEREADHLGALAGALVRPGAVGGVILQQVGVGGGVAHRLVDVDQPAPHAHAPPDVSRGDRQGLDSKRALEDLLDDIGSPGDAGHDATDAAEAIDGAANLLAALLPRDVGHREC